MHHQMGTRNPRIDFLDTVDGEDVAGRWTGKFVGAVAGTTGDGQCIDVCILDKLCRLFRISE